jgi:tRNA(Arg) A34 adenosine deaminase TadA
MTDNDFMRIAIDAAGRGLKSGEMPFGACIVKGGRVVAAVHNVSRSRMDITAHAEMHAIQQACRLLKRLDLAGCTVYATCEPCPMCFSACFWAKLDKIVYGSRIEDAERMGIRQMPITSLNMKHASRSKIEIVGDVLRTDNVELFKQWAQTVSRRDQ